MSSDSPAGSSFLFKWQQPLSSFPGMLVALLWGFAEGTFFFIIPDVFLSFVALFEWRRSWRHIVAAALGALLAGAVLFNWAVIDPPAARTAVSRVPFVRETMFTKVDVGLRSHGLLAIFLGSISGIPYKLYAVEAPRFSGQAAFLFATPPARAVRFLIVWAIFGASGSWLRRRFARSSRQLICAHVIIWVVSYSLYWGKILYSR